MKRKIHAVVDKQSHKTATFQIKIKCYQAVSIKRKEIFCKEKTTF